MSTKTCKSRKPILEIITDELCWYGCNNQALYQLNSGKKCCSTSSNKCEVIRKKNSDGVKNSNIDYTNRYNLISQETKEKMKWCKGKTYDDFFGKEKSSQIKEKISKTKKALPKKPFGSCNTEEAELERRRKVSEARIRTLENSPNVKWFTIDNIKVQGIWEYNVGIKLKELGFNIDRHSIKYDKCRRYTPDFYIKELDCYIEVKGWMKDSDKHKYKLFYLDNPNVKVLLLCGTKEYLKFISSSIDINLLPDMKNCI